LRAFYSTFGKNVNITRGASQFCHNNKITQNNQNHHQANHQAIGHMGQYGQKPRNMGEKFKMNNCEFVCLSV
jgi:hypothetical protein